MLVYRLESDEAPKSWVIFVLLAAVGWQIAV